MRQWILQQYALPLYRKPSDKDLRELMPDRAVAAQYGDLLRRPDSGVFKLVPDAGCAENSKVVNVSENCLKYLFPGAGNSFSFRTESYRIRHLADLSYGDGSLSIPGVLMNALMVDLGDIPLEQVHLEMPAVRYIVHIRPTSDYTKALEMYKQAEAGIRQDGHLYGQKLAAVAGHTYVTRSIAYQGRVMKAVQGAQYNELEFDRRRDVITAFKVIRVDADGAATIVWTHLSNAESPKLKTPSKDGKEQLTGGSKARTNFNDSTF